MTWPGWEEFVPVGDVVRKTLSRGERMHAKPAIVDDQLNVISKSQADTFGIKGTFFHSLKEARRWVALRRMADLGTIGSLRRQVRFTLNTHADDGTKIAIGVYVADFVYMEAGRMVVEDVKGQSRREDLYLWKKRHLRAEHGIEIGEV